VVTYFTFSRLASRKQEWQRQKSHGRKLNLAWGWHIAFATVFKGIHQTAEVLFLAV
jgi:hypothetical protein